MKILLTTPPNQYFNVTGFTFRFPAYNLAQVATSLKYEHELRILDNTISLSRPHDIYGTIADFKPDAIGFSIPFGAYSKKTIQIVKTIKAEFPNIILIAGGRIPTFVHDFFINGGFDYLIAGEGEITLYELIQYLSGKGGKNLRDIRGIIYKDAEGIIKINESRPLVENLDELPFASRELLGKKYSLWGYGYLTLLEASRGCAYNCSFCSQPNFWKGLRVFSNERILKELDLIKEQGFKELVFVDDSFVADNGYGNTPEKIYDLFESMRKKKLNFRFGVCLRADTICRNPDLIRFGKEAGLIWVNVGFESYTTNNLKIMNKGTTIRYNLTASDILRQNDIMIWGSHVFAYPDQTDSDLNMTIKYGRKYSDFFRLTMFTPVEGSALYEKLKNVKDSPVKDSEKLNYFNCVLNDKKQKKQIMIKFIMGLLSYYLHYKTIFNAVYNKKRYVVLMTRKAYRGAVLFVIYRFLKRWR
ncbi:MAG: B12-binding domain-containing radical SAM protein [Candidatus Omnitrophica bacterium]|nr:B12-binding domain-containing radical SAM protein [Candidatus Omnitrophota bacterium]MCG2703623.1 B12-binding domain-containing radical SAM protein [Candidatus Omnitrophota bacterium]